MQRLKRKEHSRIPKACGAGSRMRICMRRARPKKGRGEEMKEAIETEATNYPSATQSKIAGDQPRASESGQGRSGKEVKRLTVGDAGQTGDKKTIEKALVLRLSLIKGAI